MTTHHWTGRKPNPKKYFGFVYQITNKITGQIYLGKKQYHRWTKRKIVGPNKWEYYAGSSKYLTKDIKTLGKENFEFKILKNFETRGGLVYGEANLLHKKDALTKRNSDGDRVYYNRQIHAIKFIPKEG